MTSTFEKHENPEVKELFSALYHHVSHFIVLSNNGEKYNSTHFGKINEFIDKISGVSKNEHLISALQNLKNELGGINVDFKPDETLLIRINELLYESNMQEKF